MKRDGPTTIRAASPPIEWSNEPVDVYEPNFGLLASDDSWRTTWSAIIAGRFTPSLFSSLLFVERSTAYAELYETDGLGRIKTPALGSFDPLGGHTRWTHIVPGLFGPSGFTGLLLYDRTAGAGCFLDSDGRGNFKTLGEYTGWRTTWSHIVAGRFVVASDYSAVFFYSATENYGELWAVNGKGLVGTVPYQTLPDFSASTFTHILAGDFKWTPGYIGDVPTLTDLFCYDATHGRGEMFRCGQAQHTTWSPKEESTIVSEPAAVSDSLPVSATSVVAGNFGGTGNSDLAFYDQRSGALDFYSFEDTGDWMAEIVALESQSGVRAGASLVVSGNLSMANEEDHWFDDGPPTSGAPPYDPDWRFGTGGFSDLLFYDRHAGLGELYFHGPLAPPIEPLAGYITSETSLGRVAPVSTGSVLPGESIAFHVSSQCGAYSISIYQQGFFGDGETECLMGEVDGLPSDPAPLAIATNAYMDGAGWPPVATFEIPTWPSGVYFARVRAIGAAYEIDIPFVVRAPRGSEAGVLVVLADTTYHAYNFWGGRSAYGNVSGEGFAGSYPSTSAFRVPFGFRLSVDRPTAGGWGNTVQTWEIPFIQWLARRGVPFDVCTARDLHFGTQELDPFRLAAFVGHHEYWTAEMRTSVEVFARSGGNVAFFSGNVCWWQVRLTPDGRTVICYRVPGFDPVSGTADHALTTAHWFDELVKRPETSLTGVSWAGSETVYYDQEHRFTVRRSDHWVFAGTGLADGDRFGQYRLSDAGETVSATSGAESNRALNERFGSVAGPESDRLQDGATNGMTSPDNYALASILALEGPGEVGTMGVFTPHGGTGAVFNAATINWALGLSQSARGWNTIDQITANVITMLGGCPVARPWMSVAEGSTLPGAPVAAVVGEPGVVSLFVADPGGGVYTISGGAVGGWGDWEPVPGLSTTPGASIAAVASGPGVVSLFVADTNGVVHTTSGGAGVWGEWVSVAEGSTLPGAPVAAVVSGPGVVSLFLADPGGGVYTISGGVGGGWGDWEPVPGLSTTPGASIAAVVSGPGVVVSLFLADLEGGVHTISGGVAGDWGQWRLISGLNTSPGAPVAAVVSEPGAVSLFVADTAGGVYSAAEV
jgi:hypothetical protein